MQQRKYGKMHKILQARNEHGNKATQCGNALTAFPTISGA